MIMKINLSTSNAITIGEYLRDQFWPRKNKLDTGCYNNFDYAKDVYDIYEKEMDGYIYHYAKKKIGDLVYECVWMWDGDGDLTFHLPDGSVLVNNDCKKDYTWEWLLCH